MVVGGPGLTRTFSFNVGSIIRPRRTAEAAFVPSLARVPLCYEGVKTFCSQSHIQLESGFVQGGDCFLLTPVCPNLCSARSSTTTRISTVECALCNPQVTADVARFRTHDATLSVQQQAHRTSHLDMSGSPVKIRTRTVSAATGTACALQRQSAKEIQHDHEQIIQKGRLGLATSCGPFTPGCLLPDTTSHTTLRGGGGLDATQPALQLYDGKHETDWLDAACLVTLKTQCAQSTGGFGPSVLEFL